MSWFPVALAAATAGLAWFGSKDPARVFYLFFVLAGLTVVWMVTAVWKERKENHQKALG